MEEEDYCITPYSEPEPEDVLDPNQIQSKESIDCNDLSFKGPPPPPPPSS